MDSNTFTSDLAMSRRHMIGASAALGAAGLLVPGALAGGRAHAAVPAASPSGRLVVVFLRGAADHLSMTVPLDDAHYHDARPTVAIEASDALALDDRFGFHPAMVRLHERFRAGQLAPVVAVGNPAGDRSHFVSQDLLERGADSTTEGLGNGWIARHLVATTSEADSPLRAVTVGGNVDQSLVGYTALGMLSLDTFGVAAAKDQADELVAAMRHAHSGNSQLDVYAHQAIDALDSVAALPASQERDPTTAAFEDVVTLLDADLGTEIITTNIDGWDTHDNMGNVDGGLMRTQLETLDDRLATMFDRMDSRGIDDVTTVVVTEFGRRVAENGSGGTDHGWASAALVAGPDVAGGQVYGDWPGLAPDVVGGARGDVPMTTDYRDVLGDALAASVAGDPLTAFPDHDLTPTGIFERRD